MRLIDLKAGLLISIALIATPSFAKPKPTPPEPIEKPDFAEAARAGRQELIATFYDPSSAEIIWTSGFQWGFLKPIIGGRRFGWIACGTVNAKNRLGGYVGPQPFLVFKEINGLVTASVAAGWDSTCNRGPYVPVGPELTSASVASSVSVPPLGIAEELKGLAELRDKGIISQAEFETQKAKLLAR